MRTTFVLFLAAITGLFGLPSCKDSGCTTNADCPTGRICRLGLCALDVGVDAGVDADVSLDCDPAAPGDLVLNEILAKPPPGHDVNGNGMHSATGDEFIEVVNISGQPVSLANVQIQVNDRRAGLGAFCLDPMHARVLFGIDGLPTLANAGATVSLLIDNQVAQTHSYGSEGGRDQSLTLAVQLDPASGWVLHSDLTGLLYSPGKCANGHDFPNCDLPPIAEGDPDVTDGEVAPPACTEVPEVGDLVINEVLTNPGTTLDANQDGIVSGSDDEFVEVLNVSSRVLALGGVQTVTGGAVHRTFTFPAGTCVDPGQAAVIFSKYEGGGDFGGALVFGLGQHLNLTNTGGFVTLRAAAGGVLDEMTYTQGAGTDQVPSTGGTTLTRNIDGDIESAFIRHTVAPLSGGAPMSPGRCQNGNPFPNCATTQPEVDPDVSDGFVDAVDATDTTMDTHEPDVGPTCGGLAAGPGDLRINEIMARPGATGTNAYGSDWNEDNACHHQADEYVEIVNISGAELDVEGVQLVVASGATPLKYTVGTRSEATTCLAPGGAILVFGGGSPTVSPPNVIVAAAGTTNGLVLTVGGTTVTVRAADGTDIDSYTYGSAGQAVSWVRASDGDDGPMVLHSSLDGATPATVLVCGENPPVPYGTPGYCSNGSPFPSCLLGD